jgi:hypothetical protein
MGRSKTPKFKVEVDSGSPAHGNTAECWWIKDAGNPTKENLAKFVHAHMRSLESGGPNAHLSRAMGFIPYPKWAKITENRAGGAVVAEWAAPMFMAVGPSV